jgi:hypothetical protein
MVWLQSDHTAVREPTLLVKACIRSSIAELASHGSERIAAGCVLHRIRVLHRGARRYRRPMWKEKRRITNLDDCEFPQRAGNADRLPGDLLYPWKPARSPLDGN